MDDHSPTGCVDILSECRYVCASGGVQIERASSPLGKLLQSTISSILGSPVPSVSNLSNSFFLFKKVMEIISSKMSLSSVKSTDCRHYACPLFF